ncbi:MAG: acetyl-CoA carboxylase, carboxyltransferase subunit beta [Cyanobacteriota bacterium]|nr:acetyl-CoA carboxylase, carboxyltransferase subunit beta [Cyanobacteriota bacterium]
MSLFDWFADRRKESSPALTGNGPLAKDRQLREIADGLWQKCPACASLTYTKDLTDNFNVCPHCHHHHRLSAPERIRQLIDSGTWQPLDERLSAGDPLKFVDQKPYPERIKAYQDKTQIKDAILTGLGQLQGIPLALGVMDFRFMGGSMGSVVGEKVTRLTERATRDHLPLVILSASGGARMQEGILSLMQMAKTAAALQQHRAAGELFISVLTDPTTGGVTASFAMLGDLILAEPKAQIGFAGRRVIEQTIGQSKLPEGFQTSEYLLAHGLIDAIVPRTELRKRLAQLLEYHRPHMHVPTPHPEASLPLSLI